MYFETTQSRTYRNTNNKNIRRKYLTLSPGLRENSLTIFSSNGRELVKVKVKKNTNKSIFFFRNDNDTTKRLARFHFLLTFVEATTRTRYNGCCALKKVKKKNKCLIFYRSAVWVSLIYFISC